MGGNAFKQNVRRVTKQEVMETVDWLSKEWPGAGQDTRPLSTRLLGSAGLRPTSGDIDLNIDQSLYSLTDTQHELERLLGVENVKARPGFNQIFTAVPIAGNASNGMVQVDFMFGDYDWQEFGYASCAEWGDTTQPTYLWSRFKGLFRTELIKAMVAFRSNWVLSEGDEMVARSGPTFFHDRGIVWRHRHRPFKKDGSGVRIKALKELTRDEFLEQYPDATVGNQTQTLDPNEVARLILDYTHDVESCATYESLWSAARGTHTHCQLKQVSRIYLERLNSLKVEIPEAILNDHSTTRTGT